MFWFMMFLMVAMTVVGVLIDNAVDKSRRDKRK